MAVMIALFGCNSMYATADLLFSPVFHNHPDLKIMLSEGGIGWVPYMLERMDQTWNKHRFYQNINQTVRPSELFSKHLFGCFIDDQHGLASRHEVGIDNITWECDYPHSDSNWPNSRKVVHDADDRHPRRRGPQDRRTQQPEADEHPAHRSDTRGLTVDDENEQIPRPDWVDQDLLTNELAESLLDKEIAEEEARLSSLTETDAIRVRARIAAMKRAQASARARQAE